MSDAAIQQSEHYVYIYREKNGIPFYIGRGMRTGRAVSHTGPQAHNDALKERLYTNQDYFIEISGPFGTELAAAQIESALISAIKSIPGVKLLNKVAGISEALFRPIGVPSVFSDRASMPELGEDELKSITKSQSMLLVYVTDKHASDGRKGVDLAEPPTSIEILARIEKWWQLNSKMPEWKAHPDKIPDVLGRGLISA